VVELGRLLLIWITRFLCPVCGRTTSCLPSFAQPYRLMATDTIEAFLQGRRNEPGIAQYWDLLQANRRQWERRAAEIEAITGAFFGPAGDEAASQRLLGAMLSRWENLQRAGVELLDLFGEALLGRYRIHEWARAPRRSVDPLRKPSIKDSG
jgi:hypothetical protein